MKTDKNASYNIMINSKHWIIHDVGMPKILMKMFILFLLSAYSIFVPIK